MNFCLPANRQDSDRCGWGEEASGGETQEGCGQVVRDQCGPSAARAREKKAGRRLRSWDAPFSVYRRQLEMVEKLLEKSKVKDETLERNPRVLG